MYVVTRIWEAKPMEARRAATLAALIGEVYEKAGAADRYACNFHPGPHKLDLKMQGEAFEWFDRWLGIRRAVDS